MGVWNFVAAAAILLSPWRDKIWPLAVFAILADPSMPDPWTDPEARKLIEETRKKLLEEYHNPVLVDAAIKWAVDLATKMYEKIFGGTKMPPEEARKVFLAMLRKYLQWAGHYVAGIMGAAAEVETELTPSTREEVRRRIESAISAPTTMHRATAAAVTA